MLVASMFSTQVNAQNKVIINREVETSNGSKILLGQQSRDQFLKEPYAQWFTPEYDSYEVDEPTIEALKKHKLTSYNIKVFLGTWCGDSHREVPRLMKILDLLKYPENKVVLIALNRKKEGPNGEETSYSIKRVPTIILEKHGKEIGRIIESPQSTGFLEKDLLEIITKK